MHPKEYKYNSVSNLNLADEDHIDTKSDQKWMFWVLKIVLYYALILIITLVMLAVLLKAKNNEIKSKYSLLL
jgi:hypothetical protein